MPALKPTSTGSEMKLATKPRRKTDARISMAPTISVRSAVAWISVDVSPLGATRPSSAAVRIASVAEVVTLRGRDVPSTA
jgi:hypothetical protein